MKHFLAAIFNLLLNLKQFSREHSIWKINVSIAFQVCFWWRITAIFQLWKCLCCSCIYWEVSFTWTSLIIDLHPTTDRGVPFQLSPGLWVPTQNVLQSCPFPVLFLHGPQDYSVGSFSADRQTLDLIYHLTLSLALLPALVSQCDVMLWERTLVSADIALLVVGSPMAPSSPTSGKKPATAAPWHALHCLFFSILGWSLLWRVHFMFTDVLTLA